jgi:hypothetical protein
MGRRNAGGGGPAILAPTGSSLIQQVSAVLLLADLQALGAVLTSTINVGAALPANARVLGAEIQGVTPFTGAGLVSALCTMQGGADAAGTLVAAFAATAAGFGVPGSKPYASRGAQQITLTVTLVGINLSALTAGAITARAFYAIL